MVSKKGALQMTTKFRVVAETPPMSKTYGGVLSTPAKDERLEDEREERRALGDSEVLNRSNDLLIDSKVRVL